MSDKYASREEILLLWSGVHAWRNCPKELRFKTRFCALFRQFTGIRRRDLPARYRGERPSLRAQVPRYGCRAENLWYLWPGFIGALRATLTDVRS